MRRICGGAAWPRDFEKTAALALANAGVDDIKERLEHYAIMIAKSMGFWTPAAGELSALQLCKILIYNHYKPN